MKKVVMTKLKNFELPSELASPCPATQHYPLGIPHREKKCYERGKEIGMALIAGGGGGIGGY